MARRKTVEARVELAFVQPWFSATFLSVTCAQTCTCVGLSGSDGGTVVETCEAGTLTEHELEEDGVNVWSELSRRRKSHSFATPTLCNSTRQCHYWDHFLDGCSLQGFLLTADKSTALSEGTTGRGAWEGEQLLAGH